MQSFLSSKLDGGEWSASRSDRLIPRTERWYLSNSRFRIGCGVHSAPCSVCTGVLARGYSGRGVKLNIHLYSVPRLRIRIAITPLPLFVLMEWTAKNFVFVTGK